MKKIIALLLVTVMCFSFAACGETNEEKQEAENSVTFEVGDLVSTDKVEFTLEEFHIGKYYSNSDERYAIVSCTIKNIGKTKLDDFAKFTPDEGGTRIISGIMRLNYNNGFIFQESLDTEYWDYEPLSPAVEHTIAYSIPVEVIENTENPLLLELVLPNEDGTMSFFTYKLR